MKKNISIELLDYFSEVDGDVSKILRTYLMKNFPSTYPSRFLLMGPIEILSTEIMNLRFSKQIDIEELWDIVAFLGYHMDDTPHPSITQKLVEKLQAFKTKIPDQHFFQSLVNLWTEHHDKPGWKTELWSKEERESFSVFDRLSSYFSFQPFSPVVTGLIPWQEDKFYNQAMSGTLRLMDFVEKKATEEQRLGDHKKSGATWTKAFTTISDLFRNAALYKKTVGRQSSFPGGQAKKAIPYITESLKPVVNLISRRPSHRSSVRPVEPRQREQEAEDQNMDDSSDLENFIENHLPDIKKIIVSGIHSHTETALTFHTIDDHLSSCSRAKAFLRLAFDEEDYWLRTGLLAVTSEALLDSGELPQPKLFQELAQWAKNVPFGTNNLVTDLLAHCQGFCSPSQTQLLKNLDLSFYQEAYDNFMINRGRFLYIDHRVETCKQYKGAAHIDLKNSWRFVGMPDFIETIDTPSRPQRKTTRNKKGKSKKQQKNHAAPVKKTVNQKKAQLPARVAPVYAVKIKAQDAVDFTFAALTSVMAQCKPSEYLAEAMDALTLLSKGLAPVIQNCKTTGALTVTTRYALKELWKLAEQSVKHIHSSKGGELSNNHDFLPLLLALDSHKENPLCTELFELVNAHRLSYFICDRQLSPTLKQLLDYIDNTQVDLTLKQNQVLQFLETISSSVLQLFMNFSKGYSSSLSSEVIPRKNTISGLAINLQNALHRLKNNVAEFNRIFGKKKQKDLQLLNNAIALRIKQLESVCGVESSQAGLIVMVQVVNEELAAIARLALLSFALSHDVYIEAGFRENSLYREKNFSRLLPAIEDKLSYSFNNATLPPKVRFLVEQLNYGHSRYRSSRQFLQSAPGRLYQEVTENPPDYREIQRQIERQFEVISAFFASFR